MASSGCGHRAPHFLVNPIFRLPLDLCVHLRGELWFLQVCGLTVLRFTFARFETLVTVF